MPDNAINDKYFVPKLRIIKSILDNHIPRVQLLLNSGNPIITENSVILNEVTGDSVVTDLIKQYDIINSGLVFECILPEFTIFDNIIYIGGNYYGAIISNYNQIQFWSNEVLSETFTYETGDVFRQLYDSSFVIFSLNGIVKSVIPISNNYPTEFIWIGFEIINPTENSCFFDQILAYVTSSHGDNGINGTDGNTILSGSQNPSNLLGKNGDYYIDVTNNFMYGPKNNSWPILNPVDPLSSIKTLSNGGTTQLWNFIDQLQYTNILIYLSFAVDAIIAQPINIVQIAVNISNDAPEWYLFGTLPSNVSITIVNIENEKSINLHHSGVGPIYNYIGVRILTIH